MNNKTCPYTCLPISEVAASREHIVPDALGGPNGFALVADVARNSRYGETVDSRLINSTLMGQAAAEAGVMTRSGPATWSVRGYLEADGAAVQLTGSHAGVDFRFRHPVEVDAAAGGVRAIRGFGSAMDAEIARVRKDLGRKGRDLGILEERQTVNPVVRGRFEHNISEALQGLTKIAYLATVWAVGAEFISTKAGARYRSWIDAEPTTAALEAVGLQPAGRSLFSEGGPNDQHLISCMAAGDHLVTGVRLFSKPYFEVTIAVQVPELKLPHAHGWLATIDAKAKTFRETMLVP